METLADRISRDGPLNELDAVGWAIRLAKRIEALHALGVAHGSISPECVITGTVAPGDGGTWQPTPDPAFVPGGAANPTSTPLAAARGTGRRREADPRMARGAPLPGCAADHHGVTHGG